MATPNSTPASRSRFFDFLGFLVPVAFFLCFIVGIPLGYKLVLGGNSRPLAKGRVDEITFRPGVPEEPKNYWGKSANVLSHYVVIPRDNGTEAWIPRESILSLSLRPE